LLLFTSLRPNQDELNPLETVRNFRQDPADFAGQEIPPPIKGAVIEFADPKEIVVVRNYMGFTHVSVRPRPIHIPFDISQYGFPGFFCFHMFTLCGQNMAGDVAGRR
jgi:hypothetical protein